MSLTAAIVSPIGGADSEANETEANDNNDLDVNCIPNFDSSENEEKFHIVVPPPPPTSPESVNENQSHDESETEMVTTSSSSMRDPYPVFPTENLQENHGLPDSHVLNHHHTSDHNTEDNEEVTDMDRDLDEEELPESHDVHFQPSSSFVNDMGDLSNSLQHTSTITTITDVFSTPDPKASNGLANSSTMYFQAYNPPYHQFTIPSFSFSSAHPGIEAPPPSPIASTTNLNTCKALMKFEFSELPKLMCQFVEPPAGLQFISLEQFGVKNTKGYNLVPPSIPESGEISSQCTALIPYEYEQRDLRNKSYSRWKVNKIMSRRSKSHCPSIIDRKEHDEKRLHQAASTKNIPVLSKLLETGVDPNAADDLGRTSLHLSACKGHIEVVRLLLQAGANPNKKDTVGNTPLHLAACSTHFDVVTCLLRAGTDVRTLDNRGRNPLQLAQSKLKLIASSKQQPVSEDAIKIKMEVQQIIEMMLEYLQKKGQDVEAELLNAFANRLTLSQTKDEVDAVLNNLSSLSLGSTATRTMNPSPPQIFTSDLQQQQQQSLPNSSSILQPSKLLFFPGNNVEPNSENLDTSSSISVNTNDLNCRSQPFSFFK